MANTALSRNRSEEVFEDYKEPYNSSQAVAEANRCLYCVDAPCIKACPTGINIPEFIRKISTGNIKGSARTILSSNIFGMSCARVCPVETLCVGDCVYNNMEQPPIQIGKLQRYATDEALGNNWQFFAAGKSSGNSVGLIGGGPASLACAHELRKFGHAVTVYERGKILGGLNSWGVAPHKLRADKALEEIQWLRQIGGIEVKFQTEVGTSITWSELRKRHQALFIGIGLGHDQLLDVPGNHLDGVFGAVEFIEKMKLSQVDVKNVGHAVVVGGGNTAVDCVRELRTLGIPNVVMLYRGTEKSMSGYAHEWEAAKVEGCQAIWQAQPLAMEGDKRVTTLYATRLDDRKKPITGTEFRLSAELVLYATGQAKHATEEKALPGLAVKNGAVVVGKDGATGCKGVYAGGDCVNGGKEVVNAVAEGRDAARGINSFLTGGK